ncbi:MAG: carbohydrate kinase [Salinibacter sp.]|uniref:carbohydrate kinase n=1 Tax=Salinibacter sp. TaxID=2065818 RepID=UPI0035D4B85B
MSDEILCVGEILWDALPDGLFLGGAPFNVASHLRVLGRETAFVSRVGDDRLGREALRRMRARGLGTDLMQIDDSLPTGFVQVELGSTGEPDYDILEPAAWDAITFTDTLGQHAEHADALVYGSLAQRALTSRQTIQRLCEADLLRAFDINLRPPFVDPAVVEQSLETADVVKLNDDELHHLQDWFDLSDDPEQAMSDLAATFDASAVCMTGGEDGAWLWRHGKRCHHPGYAVSVADTVGAGDSFLAALLTGLLSGWEGSSLLEHANRLGAFVASRSGALPTYRVDTLADISELPLESPGATA